MKRDDRAYLHEIREAGGQILTFTENMTLVDYSTNELVRAAVERKFSIIGEILVRPRDDYPSVLEELSDTEKIVGFRNVLIHGYDVIDHATVWSAIETNLPILLEEVGNLQDP